MGCIKSMTGFASLRKNGNTGAIAIDLKSVNSRYFEVVFKLPDGLKSLEGKLREILKQQAPRGKFECLIRFTPKEGSGLEFNHDLIKTLVDEANKINEMAANACLNPIDILNFPGVIVESGSMQSEIENEITNAFYENLLEFSKNRESEGQRLAQALLNRLELIENQLVIVKDNLDSLTSLEREKIKSKLEKLNLDIKINPDLIEQEVVLQAQNSDIAEEYDRLQSHIKEVRKILQTGGSCGKRLDFMMQEFNREANTMASKASSLNITAVAVELKVLIEQMREQVQNID